MAGGAGTPAHLQPPARASPAKSGLGTRFLGHMTPLTLFGPSPLEGDPREKAQ